MQEFLPSGFATPLRRRFESVPSENIGNCAPCCCMTEICQCALNSAISPLIVLLRHLNNQPFDRGNYRRSTRTSLSAAIGFLSDQSSVPAQQRLRLNDCGNVSQKLPSDSFRLCGQSAALVIAEPQTPNAELLTKNTLFFAEIFDHLQLAQIHPSGNGDQQKPEWIKVRHLVIIYAIPN